MSFNPLTKSNQTYNKGVNFAILWKSLHFLADHMEKSRYFLIQTTDVTFDN